MQKKPILLALGNPLLDINASVDKEFLVKYCLEENGAVPVTEQNAARLLPIYDEVLALDNVELMAGGSVLNTVRVFQWAFAKIGGEKDKFATFFGAIGKDRYGKLIVDKNAESGVDGRFQYIDGVETGKCTTLIIGQNRSMVGHLGAAKSFTVDFLKLPENIKIIESVEFIYSAAHFLRVNIEALLFLAESALRRKKPFIFNLSVVHIVVDNKKEFNSVLPYVDILFGNDQEAMAYAEVNGFHEDDVKKIAQRLANLEKKDASRERLVIITREKLPVIVAHQNGTEVREFPVHEIPEGKLVDTNGAGDALAGGFMAGLACGYPLEKCMDLGLFAAAAIIQQRGCTLPP